MRDQVARHLERARLAARLTVVGSVTDVAPVVTALARTMEKIHRDQESPSRCMPTSRRASAASGPISKR